MACNTPPPTPTMMNNINYNNNEVQSNLESYLNAFLSTPTKYPRSNCCGSSKSLYCTECHKLLLPQSQWPPSRSIQEGHLQLPFDLDVILADRKKSATGFHAVVLLKAAAESLSSSSSTSSNGSLKFELEEEEEDGGCRKTCRSGDIGGIVMDDGDDTSIIDSSIKTSNARMEQDVTVTTPSSEIQSNGTNYNGTTTNTRLQHSSTNNKAIGTNTTTSNTISSPRARKKVRLFCVDNDHTNSTDTTKQPQPQQSIHTSLPSYYSNNDQNKKDEKNADNDDNNENNTKIQQPAPQIEEGTFLLFPSDDSIPLSSVASKIKRLVVLDCKWTRSFTQQRLPELGNMQKVHLDSPPTESFYWRYHNAGPGMVSTLEAIYYAAHQIMNTNQQPTTTSTTTATAIPTNDDDDDVYKQNNNDFSQANRDALIDLMWLFGIQRAATSNSSVVRDGRPVPFSKEGKDWQRVVRRTVKGSEKHLRDIEKGKRLKLEGKM